MVKNEDQIVEDEFSVDEELKDRLKGKFRNVDIEDFSEFNLECPITEKGIFSFKVEQKFLKIASDLAKITNSSSKMAMKLVRIVLFEGKMKLATFNQSAFSENVIPLEGVFKKSKPVSFIFDLEVLSKVCDNFSGVLSFKFDADKNILVLQSKKTHLELSTYPEKDFVKYDLKIDKKGKKINVERWKEGLNFASLFTLRNEMQLAMSLVEVRDSEMVGGSYSAVNIFQSKDLKGLDFRVKYEAIGILDKVLLHFNAENTYLFESSNFYILRDENLFFGFEKSNHCFPPTKGFLNAKMGAENIISKNILLESLQKLSVVSIDRNLEVECVLEDNKFNLATKDVSGKPSTDVLAIKMKDSKIECFNLSLASFVKAISYFDVENICFSVIEDKAILIKGKHEGFETFTVLSMLADDEED